MTNKFVCKKCGKTVEVEVSQSELEFAKETGSKNLVAVWVCNNCGSDNTTEIEIPK